MFPGSVHVRDAGLARAADAAVREYARDRGLTIVSKDSDFRQASFVWGPPPKVIWIRRGNCTTADIDRAGRIPRHLMRRVDDGLRLVLDL